ncbi:hypothetical protein JHK84_040847 [Glycine max]|nr:hypothetical protein JHK84_040847 [Glycine max]
MLLKSIIHWLLVSQKTPQKKKGPRGWNGKGTIFSYAMKPYQHQVARSSRSYFEIISALVWKHIACIRGDNESKAVTICTRGIGSNEFSANDLVLSIVEANVLVGKSNMSNLAKPIGEEKRVENVVVKKLVEESQGKEDCVDLEEGDMYEVVVNGH